MERQQLTRLVVAVVIIVVSAALVMTQDVPWEVGFGAIVLVGVGYGVIEREAIRSLLGR